MADRGLEELVLLVLGVLGGLAVFVAVFVWWPWPLVALAVAGLIRWLDEGAGGRG